MDGIVIIQQSISIDLNLLIAGCQNKKIQQLTQVNSKHIVQVMQA